MVKRLRFRSGVLNRVRFGVKGQERDRGSQV